jgi:hypothetical protein
MIPLVLTAAMVVLADSAFAATRTLYRADSFLLRARLGHRLVIRHVNLTDYPVRFHCVTSVAETTYRSSGTLIPHEVWKPHLRAPSSGLRGASADCDVNVHDRPTILWKGGGLEVLATGFTRPSGAPETRFAFYDITRHRLRFVCTWEEILRGDPNHQRLADRLPPYGVDRLDERGVNIRSISNFACTTS